MNALLPSFSRTNLCDYVEAVRGRVRARAEDSRLHADQRRLLKDTLDHLFAQSRPGELGDPLALLFLVFRAHGRSADERTEHVGAFCLLYLAALDLFDDVQDEDLAGKPHETAGPALAVNSAIALLFLALDSLRRALSLEQDVESRLAFLEILNRVSIVTVSAQHADLLGERAARTPSEVLAMHRGKTSTVALFTECGALLGGVAPADLPVYRALGEDLAALIQIVDDLRDIYGKEESPDLVAKRMTYPLACFLESASATEEARFSSLSEDADLESIRVLLHESGAVDACAEMLEELRVGLHARIASLGPSSAELRILLSLVDSVVHPVYEPTPVPDTKRFFEPEDAFSRAVVDAARDFSMRLADFAPPSLPRFEPWHFPLYLYDPKRRVVHYPDVDGMPDEIVPFFSRLWGTDAQTTAARLRDQMPILVAHELFHLWRDEMGRLGADAWHEEYVANRLAVQYAGRFERALLERVLGDAERVFRLHRALDDDAVRNVLERASEASDDERGYELELEQAAVVHYRMIERFARELSSERATADDGLERDLEKYLGSTSGSTDVGLHAAE